ncbi:MAG: ribbon-helix-helix protein, CopG family [Candidatus Dadabacteria bacterium]|nr:MAG: ribbon-helix-helix protein, CopG family [Candidatus Dadabacteria bacterium]
MKTTLIIDDSVMARLKRLAARQGKTISELVESAVRVFLRRRPDASAPPSLPEFDGAGAFVDIADRDELYRAMENR